MTFSRIFPKGVQREKRHPKGDQGAQVDQGDQGAQVDQGDQGAQVDQGDQRAKQRCLPTRAQRDKKYFRRHK